MTKREILKLTGLTEKEFYKLYPTKEAYEMKFGGIHSNNKMQDGGNPIVYPQQPTEDQFFNYGASYNVGIPYMEYGGPYPQQGTADEFFNFGKPAPSLNFYQTGGNVQDQIIQIIEKFAEINNIAPQNIIDELKNMGQGEQQEAIQQMLEYVQANTEQEVSQDLYGQGLTQEEYPENSPEDYTEDMTQESQSMKMGGKKLKKYQGYNSIVNENNKKDESYLNKTSDFAKWLRNTALQSDMEETMGKMQKGGPFEKTYKGRTYIVDPTTKTVIDKATGTDATKMAGLEFPDIYRDVIGSSPRTDKDDVRFHNTFYSDKFYDEYPEYRPNYNKLTSLENAGQLDSKSLKKMANRQNFYRFGYREAAADILNNEKEIKNNYYQGVNKKALGGRLYADGGELPPDEGTSYVQYDEAGNPITANQLYNNPSFTNSNSTTNWNQQDENKKLDELVSLKRQKEALEYNLQNSQNEVGKSRIKDELNAVDDKINYWETYGVSKPKEGLYYESNDGMNYSEKGFDNMSFNSAFGEARKQGMKTFTWRGKSYGTKLKGQGSGITYAPPVTSELKGFPKKQKGGLPKAQNGNIGIGISSDLEGLSSKILPTGRSFNKRKPIKGETFDDWWTSDGSTPGFAPDNRVWDGSKWVNKQNKTNTTTTTNTGTGTGTGTGNTTNTNTNTGSTNTTTNTTGTGTGTSAGKGYRVYEGDNQGTRTRTTYNPNPNVTYNYGYDPYGYQPSYGYGQQAPYGYGYTTLGNPFLGLIGSLLSGPFGGNWGFDMIPFDYYGDNRNTTYNNALGLRGQRRPGNQKSYLEDMQRRLDRGEGIDSDEVEIYSKLKNRFQDQRDRKENKLLRKDTRLENRNRRTTDRLVDEDNLDYYFTEDQVPDEQWDPNVNKTSKDKYNEFLQYTKDRNVKLNKKNFEDVWGDWYQNRELGGGLKKKDKFDLSNQDLNTIEEKARHKPRAFMTNPNQNALSLDVNGKPERFKDLFRAQSGVAFNPADFYDPNEIYDLPEEDYNYPMENSNMLNPDPNSPIGNMPGVWETGPLPTGIQPTYKDIYGNSLFDKTTPKSDKRRGLLLRQRTPRPDDVLNTINLTTATLNQRNQKLRERQLRTRLDDPRNLFTEGYTKKRGVWYPGPGLSYGTQDPYGLDLSGPARGYFKNGGKMAIGGPIAKDYLYLTNSMIDALSNLGGQVGYID